MQPLDGLLVLDFSTLLPGPMAGLILAEAGAEVIKVERVGSGDEMRLWPPMLDGDSACFAALNRGKQSLALDLKSAEDRARLDPYLSRADVLIEQFRPGVMARLGLGPADLAARYPGLIYCSITGYGQTGPRADAAGHDLNYMAETGVLGLSLGDKAAPVVPPVLIADIAGGAYPAVMNILLALESRRVTGRGAHLDVSMTDNLFPLAWWALAQRAATGAEPGNGDHLLTGATARYHLYPAQDGRIVAVAAIEQRFWDRFSAAIDLPPALRDDQRDPAATLAEVARRIAARDGADWVPVFAKADCCCNLVEDLGAALASDHFQARGIGAGQTQLPGGATLPALPTPLAPVFRPAPDVPRPSPRLGDASGSEVGGAEPLQEG